jgi:hypothetical protein
MMLDVIHQFQLITIFHKLIPIHERNRFMYYTYYLIISNMTLTLGQSISTAKGHVSYVSVENPVLTHTV